MNEPGRITPAKMILPGVGWLGIQFFWAFYSGSMPLFLKGFTDSKFTISLVLSLAGLSGCTIPPIAGYLSDRTSTRFGRRIPYIFLGMLGTFCCMTGLPYVKKLGIVAVVSTLAYFLIDLVAGGFFHTRLRSGPRR